MRLIDGDALLRNIRRAVYPSDLNTTIAVGICESHVKDMPTIDAVPVVRCKDCRYRDETDTERGLCLCTVHDARVRPEWYCWAGDDRVVCIFCKNCLIFGRGQMRCRLSGAPVEADDWCPRGEKPGLRRKEDKDGTETTDG